MARQEMGEEFECFLHPCAGCKCLHLGVMGSRFLETQHQTFISVKTPEMLEQSPPAGPAWLPFTRCPPRKWALERGGAGGGGGAAFF